MYSFFFVNFEQMVLSEWNKHLDISIHLQETIREKDFETTEPGRGPIGEDGCRPVAGDDAGDDSGDDAGDAPAERGAVETPLDLKRVLFLVLPLFHPIIVWAQHQQKTDGECTHLPLYTYLRMC